MKLRYYQRDALNKTVKFIRSGGKSGVIVLPTGSGKSLVQAKLVEYYAAQGKRVQMLTHDSRLIQQNMSELHMLSPLLSVGVYSASLKKRDTHNQVMFAQIQSVYKRPLELGVNDIIIIDEAHLVPASQSGTYRKYLDEQIDMNNDLIIIGLTATPYRMKTGYLHKGKDALFKTIIHEVNIAELMNPFHRNNRDKQQYLSTVRSKNSQNEIDLTGVKIRGGEFKIDEMAAKFDNSEIVQKSVKELIAYTANRRKVLIYAASIKHAEHIKELIHDADIVHSKLPDVDQRIERYRQSGKYMINVDMLTTGFNVREIDCIAIMRATKSPGLYVQIVGRGTRLAENKKDCLVLDYGGNIKRHGAIDDIQVYQPTGKNGGGNTDMVRECPECFSLCHLSRRVCPDCGLVFPVKPAHETTATTESILKQPAKWHDVLSVQYYRHKKHGKPDSVRVEYSISLTDTVNEWVALDHGGYARIKALEWLSDRGIIADNVDEIMQKRNEIIKPDQVLIDTSGKYKRVIRCYFNKQKEVVI